MGTEENAVVVVVLWIVALVILFGVAWKGRRPVIGLAIMYWFQLWLIHWVGGLVHAFSWTRGPDHSATLIGFEITGYGIVGLLAGYLAGLLVSTSERQPVPPGELPPDVLRLPAIYIVSGLALYFVVNKLFAGTGLGLDAVVSSGYRLAIAGFCLQWYLSWKAGRKKQARLTLLLSMVIPFFTVSLMGFMGYGVSACMTIACFVGVFYRPRWAFVVGAGVVILLGLSLYPTYMKVRQGIRKSVWGGEGFSARLDKMELLFTEWQWFDLENKNQLDAIDDRANQNILVGKAVQYMSAGNVEYGEGETLWSALVALIPRAIWPGKPMYAGSGKLVTHYTGIRFANGISVGIGHVMELYVNFGVPGVFLGYLLLGSLLAFLDTRCGNLLLAGNWQQFTILFGIGQSFLQVIGNFAEATSSAAGSVALCLLVHAVLGKQPSGAPPEGAPAPTPAGRS
jgi:hypothetical protein